MDNKSLRQLSRAFSVKDIMTGAQLLERANTLEGAKSLFEEFDVIPRPLKGRIHGFFKRDSEELHNVERVNIVSEGTSLFDFTKLLLKSDFYFVLSSNVIIGYVHYSDLNNPLVKIPFFALSQAVERRLWEKIQEDISEGLVEELFPNQAHRIIEKKRIAEEKNMGLYWIGIFTFPRILRIARHFDLIKFTTKQIDQLTQLRNKSAHSDQPLIHEKKDVKVLVGSQNLLSSIMNGKALFDPTKPI